MTAAITTTRMGQGSRTIGLVLAGYILCRHFFDLIDTEKKIILFDDD